MDAAGIAVVAELAQEIWTEYFPLVIGHTQITYMIKMFQLADTITKQIRKNGYQYYALRLGFDAIGYLALHPEPEKNAMFLSKIYIRKDFRSR